MNNVLNFKTIAEIKEAYKILWATQKQEKPAVPAVPAPLPEITIDIDQIAESEYYAALNAGYSKRKAKAIYRRIKRNK